MAQELFYTSVPRGLLPGSQGFCTVAATRGMQPGLIEKLESLTGYKPIFAPNDANAELNPVGYFHYRTTVSGRTAHVLGRVGPAQVDYSGRTNKFAHLVVLDSSELPDCGPAALLLDPSFLESSWEGAPEWIEGPKRVPSFDQPPSFCRQWQQMTGDAGWAGVLVGSFETMPHQSIYLMYEPGEDQLVLTLFAEALALLPPEDRWAVGFSTYPSNLSPGINCHWRGAISGYADAKSLQRTGSLVWPLTPQLGRAEDGPLTRAARDGSTPPRDRKRGGSTAPRPSESFPPSAPPPVGSGTRPGAEGPNRLSAIITAPPVSDTDDDVRVIEEEAPAPRPRARPAPRREPDYPRESPRDRRRGGLGAFWGMVLGATFTLVGILVLEMAMQNGLAQKVGVASGPRAEKSHDEKESKQSAETTPPVDDLELERRAIKIRNLESEVNSLQGKVKELKGAEEKRKGLEESLEIEQNKARERGEQIQKLEQELAQLKNAQPRPVELAKVDEKKGEAKVNPPANNRPGQPLKVNSGVRGRPVIGQDLVPPNIGQGQVLFHNLNFTGKTIEILYANDLLRGEEGRLSASEPDRMPLTLTFHANDGKEFAVLDLSLEKDQLLFKYRGADLEERAKAVSELLKRCIVKVSDSKSPFFQCIYLQDPKPFPKELGQFKAFPPVFAREPVKGQLQVQPRIEFRSAAKYQLWQSSTSDIVKLFRVTECKLEIEGYKEDSFRGSPVPFPLVDPGDKGRIVPSKSFSENTVLWYAGAKDRSNGKELELSFDICVYGTAIDPRLLDAETKPMAPSVEAGQVKLRNFTVSLDLEGAQVPLFQFKDDSKFEKKKDPKKEEPKKADFLQMLPATAESKARELKPAVVPLPRSQKADEK